VKLKQNGNSVRLATGERPWLRLYAVNKKSSYVEKLKNALLLLGDVVLCRPHPTQPTLLAMEIARKRVCL